jgi:hypothetical protein
MEFCGQITVPSVFQELIDICAVIQPRNGIILIGIEVHKWLILAYHCIW